MPKQPRRKQKTTMEAFNHYLHTNPQVMLGLSGLEDKLLQQKLTLTPIDRPVYITGLARSGTTITLEFLASIPEVVSHVYGDYPFIFTPYFWSFCARLSAKNEVAKERAHKDGIFVNSQSPESMEEMIWVQFFADAHTIEKSQVLSETVQNSAFETFYRQHIRKLLYVRSGQRYVAKANYNLSRIRYLLSLFPDARFVILVREPSAFVASCMKQDALFCEEQTANPKKLKHTYVTPRFEFGLNKRPIHFGDDAVAAMVVDALNQPGQQAEGWALYWDAAYRYVQDLLVDKKIAPHIRVVRYEDLCEQPRDTLCAMTEFCELEGKDSVETFSETIHAPTYYQSPLTEQEQAVVVKVTGDTAKQFGY